MPKVSERRKREGREYTKLRREHLSRFPLCQIWLKEHNFDHTKPPIKQDDGKFAVYSLILNQWVIPQWCMVCPRATEIHHGAKRGKNYLNTDTWWSASRQMHERVEQNKKWARKKGYLK